MISTLVRVSSAPVGSSARIMRGSLTSARAMATRCCWPPESWLGCVVARARRGPPAPARSRRARVPLARRHAGVEQRQLDVLERAGARQQVELLEHEADACGCGSRPARRRRSADDVARRRAGSCRWSGGRGSRGCSSACDLPEPDGAHDRDELARARCRAMTPRSACTSVSPMRVGLDQVARLDQHRQRRGVAAGRAPAGLRGRPAGPRR